MSAIVNISLYKKPRSSGEPFSIPTSQSLIPLDGFPGDETVMTIRNGVRVQADAAGVTV